MVRSRLPVASLLGLFGALLMLSPELLVGIAESVSDVPFMDVGMHRAVAFAVEQYNDRRKDSANYFKRLRFLKTIVSMQKDIMNIYRLKMELGETACRKEPGRRMKYLRIQSCNQLPGNPEKPLCYFNVYQNPVLLKMEMRTTYCT